MTRTTPPVSRTGFRARSRRILATTALFGIFALGACDEGVLPPVPEAAPEADLPTLVGASDPAGVAAMAAARGPGAEIPGHWIVVFQPHVSDPVGLARSLTARHGSAPTFTYTSALAGFAASLSDAAVAALSRNPNVALIEQDQVVTAIGTQSNPTWGLDRIDQRQLPLDDSYTYDNDGTGVEAHILDTGIRTTHTEFGGRATFGADFIGDGREMENNGDCEGHGTHVAGTVGGATYGVAKNVSLVAVRVLGCTGSGSYAGVISGMDWVVNNHVGPAVINMSLSGGVSSTVNQAVENTIAAGVVVAAAAGNQNIDACSRSPGSAAGALTVGSSTSSDARSSFSNYGTCVDLFAPGSSIKSSTHDTDNSTGTWSGTSMATPHVAGAAALIRADDPSLTAAQVIALVKQDATPGELSNVGPGSPNLLLYSRLGGAPPPPPPPPPPSDTDVHVSAISVSATYGKKNANGTAIVSVVDDTGSPVAGATVVGDWKVNGSVMKSGASGTTDGAGDATITSGGLRQTASSDLIEFCVTDVSGTGLVYDPTANLEGCDAATAPPPPPPPPPGALTLSANVRGHNTVRLSWSGSGAASFDVHRTDLDGPGGSVIVATVSESSYTDDPPAGSWRYQVCEWGSTDVCSNAEDATTRR